MLKGKAKTDYQREYMRRRRGGGLTKLPDNGSNEGGLTVRPRGCQKKMGYEQAQPTGQLDADGNLIPEY